MCFVFWFPLEHKPQLQVQFDVPLQNVLRTFGVLITIYINNNHIIVILKHCEL